MKNIILLILFIACHLNVDAQFNVKINGYEAANNESRKQTVTRNSDDGDIFCIAKEKLMDFADLDILKFDGTTGNYIKGTRIASSSGEFTAYLVPVAIIATDDNGIIVTGDYYGEVPDNVTPLNPSYELRTVFYAKYDYDLVPQWFNIYYNGAILNTGVDYENCYIKNTGVVAVPNTITGGEDYMLLNTGYNDLNRTVYINVPKVDNTGAVPLGNDFITPSPFSDLKLRSINYLPLNDIVAITGLNKLAPNTGHPFVFTMEPDYTPVSNSIFEYKYSTPTHPNYYSIDVSNVVEAKVKPQGVDEYMLYVSFITLYDTITRAGQPCHNNNDMLDVLNLMRISPSTMVPDLSRIYQSDCAWHIINDVCIQNTVNSGNHELLIGYSDIEKWPVNNSFPSGTYLRTNYVGTALSMYKANKLIEAGNHLSLVNYGNGQFMSLVDGCEVSSPFNCALRLLKTDFKGFVNNNCSNSINVVESGRLLTYDPYDTEPESPESASYEFMPPHEILEEVTTQACQ